MMSIDLNIIAILNIYGVEYCFVINGISKSEVIYNLILKKCSFENMQLWNKVNNSIKKGFTSKPVYNEKYFKAK